jgi:hypothetical protein
MAKAIRKYGLVFSEDEVKLVKNAYHIAVQTIAQAHFLNKGMTEEEIKQKIKFGKLWEEVSVVAVIDDVEQISLTGIYIEVEEIVD